MKTQPPPAKGKKIMARKRQPVFFRQNWVEVDKSDFHFNLKKI